MPGLPSTGSISISQIQAEIDDMTASYSLRGISSHIGLSSPDAMSEFRGYIHDAIVPASGASNVGGGSGKGERDVGITFSQSTFGGGNEGVSIWTLENWEDGRGIIFEQNQSNPGTTLNVFKIYQGTGFFGPWTLRASGAASNGSISDTIYSSNGNYIRFNIEKEDGSENTLYTANFIVWQT